VAAHVVVTAELAVRRTHHEHALARTHHEHALADDLHADEVAGGG